MESLINKVRQFWSKVVLKIVLNEGVIFSCIIFGIASLITGLCHQSSSWIYLGLAVLSVGLGLISVRLEIESKSLADISVRLGIESKSLADISDRRMMAMANLEFREKIAMMWGYREEIKNDRESGRAIRRERVERIRCDLEAAKELSEWISPELKREMATTLNDFVEWLKNEKADRN